jgi:PAS domain S-box-containing protein
MYNDPRLSTKWLVSTMNNHLDQKKTAPHSASQQAGIEAHYLSQLEVETIPVGILILHGPDYIISFVNPIILTLWGRTKKQVINKPLEEALPEIKGQGFKELLDGVFTTGIPYFGNNVSAVLIKKKKKETVYFNFVYNPIRDTSGHITGIFVTAVDTTPQITAQEQAEIDRARLTDLFMQAPAMIAISRGPKLVFELANPVYLRIVGKTNSIIGKGVFEVFPEAKGQPIEKIILDVYNTGKPFYGNEVLVKLDTDNDGKSEDLYFNFVYQPTRDAKGVVDGVMTHAVEVSDIVKARKRAEEGEVRFKTLFENSTDAIQLVSPDGTILYTSSSIKNVLGYTAEELNGQGIGPFMHPDDLSYFTEKFQELIQQPGGQVVLEYRVRHKDGSWAWVETTGVNHLHTPHVAALVGTFRNITQRKKREERQVFLEKVSTILNETIDYEVTLNNVGKFIVPYLADFCRIVLMDGEKHIKEIAINTIEATKQPLIAKFYHAFNRNAHSGVGHILKTGKTELISEITPETLIGATPQILRIVKKLNLYSYMGVPMKIGSQVVGVITFSSTNKDRTYTTEDVHIAEELATRAALAIENARLYTEAQKAISLRDEFISVASHELKTPVTSLKLYEQALSKQLSLRGETDILKYFTKMDDQINKLTMLIGDLLNVSKLVHGKLEFTMEAFSLEDIIAEAVETLKEMTKKHRLVVKGKIGKNVYGDRYRIYQVVTNLLSNAIKYSPKADQVIITLSAKKAYAQVTVKDFGIGIDQEHIANLFEQFYRVTSPTEKTFPGLGMGLFIAKQIIERHNGKMTVVSSKGNGSEFSFTIPYETTMPNK